MGYVDGPTLLDEVTTSRPAPGRAAPGPDGRPGRSRGHDPPGRRHPPRPQAGQRPAGRGPAGGRRLRRGHRHRGHVDHRGRHRDGLAGLDGARAGHGRHAVAGDGRVRLGHAGGLGRHRAQPLRHGATRGRGLPDHPRRARPRRRTRRRPAGGGRRLGQGRRRPDPPPPRVLARLLDQAPQAEPRGAGRRRHRSPGPDLGPDPDAAPGSPPPPPPVRRGPPPRPPRRASSRSRRWPLPSSSSWVPRRGLGDRPRHPGLPRRGGSQAADAPERARPTTTTTTTTTTTVPTRPLSVRWVIADDIDRPVGEACQADPPRDPTATLEVQDTGGHTLAGPTEAGEGRGRAGHGSRRRRLQLHVVRLHVDFVCCARGRHLHPRPQLGRRAPDHLRRRPRGRRRPGRARGQHRRRPLD